MATWTPPTDAVETQSGWVPPSDAATVPIQTPVKQLAQPTFLENAVGAVTEPLMKMGSAMIAKPASDIGGIAAMFADYLGVAPNNPVQTKQRIQQAMTYEPRTTAGASEYNPLNAVPQLMGQAVNKVTTPVMSAIRGDAAPDTARGMAANFIGEAIPQAINIAGVRSAPAIGKAVTQAGAATGEALAARGAKTAEAASNVDWQNAARIEAAQLARKHGIVVDPALSNPTAGTKLTSSLAGSKLDESIVKVNAPKWADLYKADVGIDVRTPLDAKTFTDIRAKLSAPYGAVSKMGFVDDGTIAAALRGIEVPDVAVNAGAAPKVTAVVDNLVNKVEAGMTGKQVLAEIKGLQDSARSLMESNKVNPSSLTVAEAKAKRAMADRLYDMILTNVEKANKPELYSALKDAKVKIAQSHIAQDATNLVTNRLDPRILAKDMAEGNVQLTGVLADMGKIAGNFPSVADVSPAKHGLRNTMISRAGVGGTTGAILGSMVGMPVEGGALGATLGMMGGGLTRKKIIGEGYQAKNMVPPDRRMPIVPPTRSSATNTVYEFDPVTGQMVPVQTPPAPKKRGMLTGQDTLRLE